MSAASVRHLLELGRAKLVSAGNMAARREAALLLADLLEVPPGRLAIVPDLDVPATIAERFMERLARRAADEPISRIRGSREFWSMNFAISPAVLDPRPDTETLVSAALAEIGAARGEALRILDLGTGSGCILLALLSELPKAEGLGVDISEAALEIAAGNARRLSLESRARFLLSDWFASVAGRFDLVVSNPPYIPRRAIAGLMPDVSRYDPALALDGGEDGLDCYRALARDAARFLAPSGLLAAEVGAGQVPDVKAIFTRAGFSERRIERDLAGIERVAIFSLAAK